MDHCTSCDACINACPSQILHCGPGRTPVVIFAGNECTFCGECARACKESVFTGLDTPPWNVSAVISDACLLNFEIGCQLCRDSCDADAITFDMSRRHAGHMVINADQCTGCGACTATCPETAIAVVAQPELAPA